MSVPALAEFSKRVEKQIQDMQTKSENTKMEVRRFPFLYTSNFIGGGGIKLGLSAPAAQSARV